MKKIDLAYWISNNGDGSASVHITPNQEIAEDGEKHDFAICGEGFAEDTVGDFSIYEENGKFYLLATETKWRHWTENGERKCEVIERIDHLHPLHVSEMTGIQNPRVHDKESSTKRYHDDIREYD